MKLNLQSCLILLFLLVAAAISAMAAGTPYREDAIDVSPTETYTYNRNFKVFKLVSVEAFNAASATGTVTISRVTDDRTNTVGTITLSSNAGIYRETNTVYLFKGDQLVFTASAPETSVEIEITGDLLP